MKHLEQDLHTSQTFTGGHNDGKGFPNSGVRTRAVYAQNNKNYRNPARIHLAPAFT